MNNHAAQPESIAIIGMGCRLPGGASSPSKLWDLLINSRSGHSDMPRSRFNADAFSNPNSDSPGSIPSRGGYFIDEDIRSFENGFFGVNNLEAMHMDPQQRKLLEVVYECFENAGAPLDTISGANIGCYVANFTLDYFLMQCKDPEYFHRYSSTGMGTAILANRISHVFNLLGPSLVLDTACSSSLYCLHMACTALLASECDAAVVAGANLIQSPEMHLAIVKSGVVSSTSTCHTFDSSANGYGRAEGVGALYLKRLSDAIRDNDPIRSIIRGTAINSNGKTNGITLPSADGQEAVIRKAYAQAQLPTNDTIYVEAHGTGTPVGDPIEVDALSRVFHHKSGLPTLIGSVKTNLGHSEAVSGISSVIKVTLALEKGLIPATIGIENVNPDLKLSDRNMEIVTNPKSWPEGVFRRASINSFGYGGANAHVILEAGESYKSLGSKNPIEDPKGVIRAQDTFLLPFSANNKLSLASRVLDLASLDLDRMNIDDLAYTLGLRRSRLSTRGFILARRSTMKNDITPVNIRTKDSESEARPLPVAFIFTGQGAQWPQMGSQLIEQYSSFRDTIDNLDAYLARLPHKPTWTICGTILESPDTGNIYSAARSQPVCTAIQIALVKLLLEWGVTAEAVVGHSSGEIAAAYSVGHISEHEAITIAYYRGLIVSQSHSKGAMLAAGIDSISISTEILRLELDTKIQVACINSPESVTISGDPDGIEELRRELDARGIFARTLKTDGKAYHSHQMWAIGREYENILTEILGNDTVNEHISPRAMMVSSTTGKPIERNSGIPIRYWRTNLESPVLFDNAIQTLLSDNRYHFIEIGPHSALQLPIEQIRKKMGIHSTSLIYSSTIVRNANSVTSLLHLAGNLYLRGYDINFGTVNGTSLVRNQVLYDLPNYKWESSILWNESRASKEYRTRKFPHHNFLGSQICGTSGETASWRNLLRLREVPWLEDHKLGHLTVFPGAGYLTMAIEALRQMQDIATHNYRTIVFRQVHFIKALILDDLTGTELLTQLRRVQLSGVSVSSSWFEFDISSFKGDLSTLHATGRISFEAAALPLDSLVTFDTVTEQQATRNWYTKLASEGLRFGPTFQTLTEVHLDRERQLQLATCKANPMVENHQHSRNTIDPITIDAMFQTGIIASSGGSSHNLRGKVPVFIDEARISLESFEDSSDSLTIQAIMETVGFGTAIMNISLQGPKGQPIARISNIRTIAFKEDAMEKDNSEERYPVLRIGWKPDISVMAIGPSPALDDYATQFASSRTQSTPDLDVGRLAGVLDLITHHDPDLNILEIGIQDEKTTEYFLDVIDANIQVKRFQSYTQGFISKEGKVVGRRVRSALDLIEDNQSSNLKDGTLYNLIVLSASTATAFCLNEHPSTLLNYLEKDGRLLFITQPGSIPPLDQDRFYSISTTPCENKSTVTVAKSLERPSMENNVELLSAVLIESDSGSTFNEQLQIELCKFFHNNVARIPLRDVSSTTLPPNSVIICSVELDKSLLDVITPDEITNVQIMTDNASVILWISGGNLFKAERPEFSLVPGLSRSIMLEQPALRFCTLDIKNDPNEFQAAIDNIIAILDQALHSKRPEYEYMQHNNVLYSSRLYPDEIANVIFRKKQGSSPQQKSLQDAGHCQLSVKHVGQLDTVHFIQTSQEDATLQPDYVEVQVKCIGLNAKDIYVLGGRIDTKDSTCSLDFTGIVRRTGSAVRQLRVGDRVVVMAPSHFGTFERVPEWACCKLQDDEKLATMSTIPVIFATALYALQHRANLQKGESVLINSAAGGVGLAAIQVAQLFGAKIFATVSTEAKKQFLVDTFHLDPDHIFNYREAPILPGIMKQTSNRGVDVVLNSLTGDLLQNSWAAIAELGRFVEIGKRDILDSGKLSMELFARSATFTAFDLSCLYFSTSRCHHDIWKSLITDSIQLLRENKIKAVTPLKVFDVSEITQALKYFSSRNRIGKVVVSFENQESLMNVIPEKYNTTFVPEKTYFLVGCLGGIGRSLSKWMLKRGARRFAFLGRSALDSAPARKLVEELRGHGASVDVFRGDAGVYEDMQRAISQVKTPIGGVVHAAMGLHEALFSTMSSDNWHTSVDPKVKGVWNLHHALKGRDEALDFFLITSSMSGTVGSATESNYCAANAFLDSFARYRCSLGLPATALGLGMISEVGYLHEHPEVEAILVRKGIHAINEDEMLQVCDIALSSQPSSPVKIAGEDHFAQAHFVTGLEVLGLGKIRKSGFEGPHHMLYRDPRVAIIRGALSEISGSSTRAKSLGNVAMTSLSYLGTSLATYREATAESVRIEARRALIAVVQGLIGQKLRDVYLLKEHPAIETKLMDLGMDSMMAAELRLFLFQTFKVDVPFLSLLASNITLGSLVDLVVKGLLKI